MVSAAVLLILILVSLGVYLKGWFNHTYLYLVIVAVYIPMGIVSLWLITGIDRSRLRRVSSIIKLSMIAGLVALILGRAY